jgi:hypothetical protein
LKASEKAPEKKKSVLDEMTEEYAHAGIGSPSRMMIKKLLADDRFKTLTDMQKLILLQVIALTTA